MPLQKSLEDVLATAAFTVKLSLSIFGLFVLFQRFRVGIFFTAGIAGISAPYFIRIEDDCKVLRTEGACEFLDGHFASAMIGRQCRCFKLFLLRVAFHMRFVLVIIDECAIAARAATCSFAVMT